MRRIIDQIRKSDVSVETMRAASRGAVDAPPQEIVEILVHLTSNALFRKQAALTLAGWDEAVCSEVLRQPSTPKTVLDYFLHKDNRRPALIPALLENSAVEESALFEIAQETSKDVVAALLASPRVLTSVNLLNGLLINPVLTPAQREDVRKELTTLGNVEGATYVYDEELERYFLEHADEIRAEQDKPFELFRHKDDPEAVPHELELGIAGTDLTPEMIERLSVFQRISRMNVSERVQMAIKGNREERFILVRDGCRVVARAVLESPRLTDQEVETYAGMKNVQEGVLRSIANKRRFIKSYSIIRNLVSNPRCPLDVQLTLVKNLMSNDLRILSANREVSDTLRKVAFKMFKERTEGRGR